MKGVGAVEILQLVLSVLICQLSGLVGAYFTAPSISEWYVYLKKPSFTPPSWLFAPVWTILFATMGISVFLVWRQRSLGKQVKRAVAVFGVQLVLNVFWSATFFGLRSPIAGLVVIVVLWLAILLTILEFYRLSKSAALLLVPYILWVSFAASLNYSIFIMNL